MVSMLGVRGKKCVECGVCPLSVLNVVRFAAERLRARPIGFSVRVSMVSLPAPGPLVPEARIIPLDQAADCRMFFCSSRDANRSSEASLSPRAVLTDHTATMLLSSPRWEARVGAAEVCKVHSVGTGTSHKASSLQIHDRTQTGQTPLTCSETVVGVKRSEKVCARPEGCSGN